METGTPLIPESSRKFFPPEDCPDRIIATGSSHLAYEKHLESAMETGTPLIPESSRKFFPPEDCPDRIVATGSSHLAYEKHLEESAMETGTPLIPESSRKFFPLEDCPDRIIATGSSHLAYQKHLEESAMETGTPLIPEVFNASSQLFFHMQEQKLLELIYNWKITNVLELVKDEPGPMENENAPMNKEEDFSVEKVNSGTAGIQDDYPYVGILDDVPQSLKAASEMNEIGSSEIENTENLKRLLYRASTKTEEGDYMMAQKHVMEMQDEIGQWMTVCNVICGAMKKVNGQMDFYAILGVDYNVDQSCIEKEYTHLSLKLNPRVNKFACSELALQFVQEAKNTLADPISRNLYDIRCGYKLVHDFRKERASYKFAVDQVWAIYGEYDRMPGTYALVIQAEGTQVGYVELRSYVGDWWPFGCGQFIKGDRQLVGEIGLFSHEMNWARSRKRGNEVASFEIYPAYGEVWALYGKMDSGKEGNVYDASTDEIIKVSFEYQLVIIASDYSCSTGIEVVKLARKGGLTLFAPEGTESGQTFTAKQMHVFSHMVPSVRICGSGIRDCLLDLDGRAVPSKLM